jgi:Protein of unknown function (DUF3176)
LADFEAFDAASRGPLDALLLLYQLKSWHLASIGATVTLLALASDTFVQQSLRFPEMSLLGPATIPIAQNYSKYSLPTIDSAREVKQPFVPALYNGILVRDLSQSSSAVSASCSTGNCTFDTYASIAHCSACAEDTTLLSSSDLGLARPGESSVGGQ